MAKWCNSFFIVPKPNGTVSLCLSPARLIQALIGPKHRGPTLNYILPTLTIMYHVTISDASSGYHSLKQDKKSPYLTMFAFKFARYRFTRLPFGVVSADDMFKWKLTKDKDLMSVSGIADDILIVQNYPKSRDYDRVLRYVMQIFCSKI